MEINTDYLPPTARPMYNVELDEEVFVYLGREVIANCGLKNYIILVPLLHKENDSFCLRQKEEIITLFKNKYCKQLLIIENENYVGYLGVK